MTVYHPTKPAAPALGDDPEVPFPGSTDEKAGPAHHDPHAHGSHHGNGHATHPNHPPHLAHHFETPAQQFSTGKLGMWIFLGTEILMFGGLFCAYAVYRHNNPEVFTYAHHHLNTMLGGINTLILITSSLTMAWAVRCAQIGAQRGLVIALALTLLGGFGFLGVKAVEYYEKYTHDVWVGAANRYDQRYEGKYRPGTDATHGTATETARTEPPGGEIVAAAPVPQDDAVGGPVGRQPGAGMLSGGVDREGQIAAASPPDSLSGPNLRLASIDPGYLDPNAGSGDAVLTRPAFNAPTGVAGPAVATGAMAFGDLRPQDQGHVATFFSIYYMMTGLHGLHVLIGMGLIAWVLIKSAAGVFGPAYFTPVDLVGLYWHLVDLIWIFLFPLLYLIH